MVTLSATSASGTETWQWSVVARFLWGDIIVFPIKKTGLGQFRVTLVIIVVVVVVVVIVIETVNWRH